MDFTYLANSGGIGPEEHEFLNDEDLPIVSYGKIGPSFLTMCTRRCLSRDTDGMSSFSAYSRIAKIRHANAKFLKLYPLRTFPFPV